MHRRLVGRRMLLRVAAQGPAAARKIQAISESLRRRLRSGPPTLKLWRACLRQCGTSFINGIDPGALPPAFLYCPCRATEWRTGISFWRFRIRDSGFRRAGTRWKWLESWLERAGRKRIRRLRRLKNEEQVPRRPSTSLRTPRDDGRWGVGKETTAPLRSRLGLTAC
jgi:hypothetical protein